MCTRFSKDHFNHLSANFTNWSNTLTQFVGKLATNCLSVLDDFVKLALKGLSLVQKTDRAYAEIKHWDHPEYQDSQSSQEKNNQRFFFEKKQWIKLKILKKNLTNSELTKLLSSTFSHTSNTLRTSNFSIPVDIRRRFNVYKTSIPHRQGRIDLLQKLKRCLGCSGISAH